MSSRITENVSEHVEGVYEGKLAPFQFIVEICHQSGESFVKETDRIIDFAYTCDPIVASRSKLVRRASHQSHTYDRHFSSSVAIKCLQLLPVLIGERVCVLLRCVPVTGVVIFRHEVVVEVVIATHSDIVDTLAKVLRS